MRSGFAFFPLAASVGLACAASCFSGDDVPVGGRVEHPQPRAPIPAASAEAAQDASPPPPEGPFTPLDQAIVDDCHGFPAQGRAWSPNVPDRDCTNDSECGDGFCDRDHCAAVWTCMERYGQRCMNGWPVQRHDTARQPCDGICLEGRCRSCQSDAECATYFQALFPEQPGPWSGVACGGRRRDGGRTCGVIAPFRNRL
jgi:hypothetical protein